jgi:elongation factor P
MYSASDLKRGLKIEIDGEPYEIVDFQFSKPGKGQSIYRCKIKNLVSGATLDKSYRSSDKIDKPDLEQRALLFSYEQGDSYVFMDEESYEQIEIGANALADKRFFLEEDMPVKVLFHNSSPIDIDIPPTVEKEIAETEPGLRGDTATNVLKPAKLDNGYELQVPLFVNQGDIVTIDTRTGEYKGRAGKF